jgi:hypothetical protein
MLFSSFGHKLFLVFGLLLLATLLVVGSASGLFGEAVLNTFKEHSDPLRHYYSGHKELIDPALKWVGFLISLYGVVWTVHKSWHYAEGNLPKRINDCNARWKQEVEQGRPRFIPALADSISIALPVDPTPSALTRFVLWLYDSDRREIARTRQLARRHEDDLSVLTTSRVRCRAQIISAHLHAGARLSRTRNGSEALLEFEKALKFNRSDMDALELAARQAHALNQPINACRHLDALAETATAAGDILKRARALRYKAEVLKGGLEAERVDARDTLKGVIEVLRVADIRDDAKTLEMCLAYAGLADVQTVRNTLSAARTALNQANARFNRLGPTSRDGVRPMLNDIETRLAQAERDRDQDNEKDESGQGD